MAQVPLPFSHDLALPRPLTPTPPQAGPLPTEPRHLRLTPDLAPHVALNGHPHFQSDSSPRQRRVFFDALVAELKRKYTISIRKWRTHMSGVAYELKYRDGRIKRWITAPRPRTPVSAGIFLHEVGHHAVGFHRYSPRCLEEYYVWHWAFREMVARSIPLDPRLLRHYRRSMFHYVRLARQRGINNLPHELHQFLHWPG